MVTVRNDHLNAMPDPGRLRHDLQLSRERMARLLDISSKTVERWEAGRTVPTSREVMARLAKSPRRATTDGTTQARLHSI